ncbi:hypothetical protein QQ008_11730 [Fulvivirgaceae bacterium BMA10]|uniref:ATPase n=1 Tax=Splendidivirga corallicola TaxID=3051826 RepID=A0ABT8KMT4_9BACT|nr:hypothetical protein [Fulvivirgaceae bacterium BMA10]
MKQNIKYNSLAANLNAYKRKYYKSLLIKGLIFSFAVLITIYLFVNSLEFAVGFNSPVRAVLFFSFLLATLIIFYKWVLDPTIKLFAIGHQMSDEEAASQIGNYFPDISDKLLNTLQLQKLSSDSNSLIAASIRQRTEKISLFPFTDAINLSYNKKYLKYLLVPLSIAVIVLALSPQFFSESTTRLIQYNKEFVPQAPFQFVLLNEELRAFKNEDYKILLNFEGEAIPQNTYIIASGRRIKMKLNEDNYFEYDFQKVQRSAKFFFEAAGFSSSTYELKVVNRPNLKNFNVNLSYPKYLERDNERLSNIGNLEIPEGTKVQWQFNTLEVDEMNITFEGSDETIPIELTDNQLFSFEKRIIKSHNYSINLKNQYGSNKDNITYHIEVIPDQYPKISLNQYQDTTLYSFLALGGNISDDYGLTQLSLKYKVLQEGDRKTDDGYNTINVPINRKQSSQSYYYQFEFDSLDLQEGDELDYFLQVWDNDGVNGRKSSKTGNFIFKVPSKEEIKKELEAASKSAEKQIDKTLEKAKDLEERINETKDKLRGEKELKWQDQKRLEDILKKREELNEAIEKLKEENRANDLKRERFSETNSDIKEKAEKLQELMDELLDEETKKLYEELQKLLEEKSDLNKVQNLLDKLSNKEDNLEKELERTLELFKKLKFDVKLEETIEDINDLSEEQKNLQEESSDKKQDTEQLAEKQEDLKEKFNEFEKELEELNEINQDRKNPDPLQDVSQEQQEIKQQQQNSQQQLENNKRKKAQQSMQKAQQQMQQLSQKLQQMQSGAQMSMMQENLDHLRDIVDNLVKLSFEQEDLMDNFRKIKQSDPRFIQLSQKQLKLKDDAKIIEDSLLSLAERVFQIASFVTRELDGMTQNMDETIEALRDRKQSLAISKQQFTMTSINNLALLLDDVLQQMQQQMADAMGNPQQGQKNSQKNMPGLSELQKQLNKQIQELRRSGKSGRELSEELAKLAAEQERIRRALEEMQEKYGEEEKGGGNGSKDILKKMEETETDLVNKQITTETIKRQQDILTRLLEAEDALRERELDEKREAERAKNYEKRLPKAFEEYIKAKEKEIELLKTVPLKLNPYYKKEVNNYFQRIGK